MSSSLDSSKSLTKSNSANSVNGAKKPGALSRKPTPFYESGSWSIRSRAGRNDIYLTGFKTADAAVAELGKEKERLKKVGAERGFGPDKTTAAHAMQAYALARLPFKKGAVQEAVRFNNYLRPAGLQTLVVKEIKQAVQPDAQALPQGALATKSKEQIEGEKKGKPESVRAVYFTVTLAPHTDERQIPNSLQAHRKAQMTKTADARKHRAVLSTTTMGSISRKQIQEYMDAMKREGAGPATMKLEQALWRGLFNYAFSYWDWKTLWDNPATRLTMPKVNNARKRVLEMDDEQARLDEALLQCKNKLVLPVAILLRETAMRSSEPLKIARWRHVDWEENELHLPDSKTGSREVPLSPIAREALKKIATLVPCGPDDQILNVSYSALQSAWRKACARANIAVLLLRQADAFLG